MQTDLPSHPQAFLKLHTGNSQFVRPSLGAWTLYGLGTLNENLPGFITLTPPGAIRRRAELRQRRFCPRSIRRRASVLTIGPSPAPKCGISKRSSAERAT
jgi:hypothetical protein